MTATPLKVTVRYSKAALQWEVRVRGKHAYWYLSESAANEHARMIRTDPEYQRYLGYINLDHNR